MAKKNIYTVGGTVQAGDGIYIPRKADNELLGYCRAGEFAFILSSRQVGKSSLMVRTAQQLEKEGIRSVIIDLSSIGVSISADEWYLGILNEIANTLKLQTDIFAWWSERAGLSPATHMTNFFSDVLLKEVGEPIVLFFDEIDSTLSIPFADDFFAALRSIYNIRSTVEDFRRLSFVMIGVATPSDLIADSKRTPFNIGYRVDLTDFTPEEAAPLADGLGEQTIDWVFYWTGGHPYLTQRLCAYLSKNKIELTEASVRDVVRQLFEGEQGRQDNNLQFVRDMLTKRAPDIQRVLKTYKDIRSGKKVVDDHSIPKSHLKISGVVHRENGFLQPRNRIYEQAFNLMWVKENTPVTTMRRLKYALSFLTVIALMIAGYFVWQGYSRTDADRAYLFDTAFQIASTPKERLDTLAGMFALNGNEYSSRARNLFIGLPNEQKLELFNPATSSSVKRDQLVVALGVYQSFGFNPEVNEQSDGMLAKIRDALNDDNDTPDLERKLKIEISFWLAGRESMKETPPDYINAERKFRDATLENPQNPALYYDLARAYMGMENYSLTLEQLEIMLDRDPNRKDLAKLMIEKNEALNQYWSQHGDNNNYPILSKTYITPVTTIDAKGVSMVLIPEGVFIMGSNANFVDEKPLHEVNLSSYYIDQYEVTNAAYKLCVNAGVCQPPLHDFSSTRRIYYGDSQFDNYPVIYVNWNMSNAYCEWRGAHLPSEAEWEKAAHGTDKSIYPWGQDIDCRYANYSGGQNGSDCVGDTTPVGSYASGQSSYGVYDMAGNVWEWVNDWYSSGYYQSSPLSNPLGPASGQYRVLRGGSWSSDFYYVRSADRHRLAPGDSYNLFGFRCSRSLP